MSSSVEENITRVYTINLGRAWLTPEHKRTDRVINMIKEFARKHMKSGDVKLDQDLNRQMWSRGKTNPPRKVRVKMVKDEDDVVTVSLYEEPAEAAPASALTTTEAPPAATTATEETKAEEEKTQSK
ncbi:MAG TPA: 50S ribosomal protein L31e [Nitrososphaera sp.]|nr:50S ribosomal protein L31e [Nitrososphaera sp.]